MNIYLISNSNHSRAYDYYTDAVVIAESEEQARHIHPDGSMMDGSVLPIRSWEWDWSDPKSVMVKLIGTTDSMNVSVVLAQYIRG